VRRKTEEKAKTEKGERFYEMQLTQSEAELIEVAREKAKRVRDGADVMRDILYLSERARSNTSEFGPFYVSPAIQVTYDRMESVAAYLECGVHEATQRIEKMLFVPLLIEWESQIGGALANHA